MKNLAAFDIIQKVVSFETGGWENTKKGVYRIRDNYVNFWFHFIYPHLSDLYMIRPEEFYDRYIAPDWMRTSPGILWRYAWNIWDFSAW